MNNTYSLEDKIKYVSGFKKCHLTIGDYCSKMRIAQEDLKQWLKEITHIPKFGEIKIAELEESRVTDVTNIGITTCTTTSQTTGITPIKFETDTIKLELKPNYDKSMLLKLIQVITQ